MQASVTLSLDEWQFLINVLGELPSKTAVFPFIMKIKTDVEAQLNADPAKSEVQEPAGTTQ